MKTQASQFATTFQRFESAGFGDMVQFIETNYISPQKHTLYDELKRVIEILRDTKSEPYILLSSTSGKLHPDVLAGILMRLRTNKNRPKLVLFGDMWAPSEGIRGWVEHTIMRLLDPLVVAYIVQSTEELTAFPDEWKVNRDKMRLCLYYSSVTENELLDNPQQEDFIFAGGNSKRNYEPLIEAARKFPNERFVIASHLLGEYPDMPPNVEAGQVSHEKFMSLMQTSKAVVTPMKLRLKRAAGQQTYLNAMLMKKPVIVSDGFGVADHIRNGIDGLVVNGSVDSYLEALSWLLASENEAQVKTMAQSGHQRTVQEFSLNQHVKNLLQLMDDIIQETK